MGLRETKKAKTRQHISDIGCALFMERGFENVTVAEIAAKAEVAVATLFNYFPTKESILFDREDEIEDEILNAIRNRQKGTSIIDALHKYFLASKMINPPNKRVHAEFMKLIRSSPELSAYFQGLWRRYANHLAGEIQSVCKANEAQAIASLILEGVNFACNSDSPRESLNATFKLLKNGWKK